MLCPTFYYSLLETWRECIVFESSRQLDTIILYLQRPILCTIGDDSEHSQSKPGCVINARHSINPGAKEGSHIVYHAVFTCHCFSLFWLLSKDGTLELVLKYTINSQ